MKSTAGSTSASPNKGPGANVLIFPRRMSGGKRPPRPVVKTSMPGLRLASLLKKRSSREGDSPAVSRSPLMIPASGVPSTFADTWHFSSVSKITVDVSFDGASILPTRPSGESTGSWTPTPCLSPRSMVTVCHHVDGWRRMIFAAST